ncbi:MAG: HAMP domain-containing histidine kinase [Ruminococcus sp.]|nr:HAMP domain-containing histidine kinase [Ruminococcus sp.]
MINKLRRKFVLIAVLSLFVVELVIVGVINGLNFYNVNEQADTLLSLISEGGGKFPDTIGSEQSKRYSPDNKPDAVSSSDDSTRPDPPEVSGTGKRNKSSKVIGVGEIDIETRYSTRYFTVTTNLENDIKQINTSHIAAVSAKQAKEFAQSILESGDKTGYKDNYKYLVTTQGEEKLIIVVDVNSDIKTARNFFLISLLVAFGSLLVVTVLVTVFSKRAIRPAVENMERQKQFIVDAGHEIKTPLAIISANTEVIEMLGGDNEWLDSIKHQTKRLSDLVQRLLKLAKMEDEVIQEMVITDFNISDAVADVAEPFVTLAKSKNKDIELDIEENLTFTGDEASVRELVSILTENAVKYADEDTVIKISLKRHGKETHLSVFNKGDPIAEESLSRLFDRFYREDSSRTRETGGSGIGLSIARSIVNAHKGSISAKNTDGGILFTAVLVRGKEIKADKKK